MATECQGKVSHKQHNLICSRVTTSLYGTAICLQALGGKKKLGPECHWVSTNVYEAEPASERWESVANKREATRAALRATGVL